jgi:hypothetical protein
MPIRMQGNHAQIGCWPLLSRNDLKIFDFRNPFPYLLFDLHNDCHDHAWAAITGSVQAHPYDAVIDIDDFNIASVHFQRRPDFRGQNTGHSSSQIVEIRKR